MTGIVMFIAPSSLLQICFALGFCTLYLTLTAYTMPFVNSKTGHMQVLSLLSQCSTLVTGLLLSHQQTIIELKEKIQNAVMTKGVIEG
jgi:hypothetical protein